jgi:PBP1b-binding outer membrane lipoprotein LpoB
MKKILLLSGVIFLFSGCTTKYYYKCDGKNCQESLTTTNTELVKQLKGKVDCCNKKTSQTKAVNVNVKVIPVRQVCENCGVEEKAPVDPYIDYY